jgi:hypothetical protein
MQLHGTTHLCWSVILLHGVREQVLLLAAHTDVWKSPVVTDVQAY